MRRIKPSDYWHLLHAFLWLESQIMRQYRWAILVQGIQFLVLLLIFASLPIDAGGGFAGVPYVQYVLTGFVYQIFYESVVNGPTSRLSELQLSGQLQLVLSAPFPRWSILLAAGCGSALYGIFRALVVMVGGILIFQAQVEVVSWSALVAVLAYTMLLAMALALFNVSTALLWPRVNLTSFFSSLLLGLLSGVFIPLDRLPRILQPLAVVNPLRWGLDVFRFALGQHSAVGSETWLAAGGALVILVSAAAVIFRRADRALVRENRYQNF